MLLRSIKRTAKSAMERAAEGRARRRLARTRTRRTLVLAFHNVVRDDADTKRSDESLHLSLRRFTELLDTVAALPNVQLARRPVLQETDGAAVQVLVTFDDAYRGAVRLALPALAERGAAAVIFVAPALLGQRTAWWDLEYPRHRERGDAAWALERERLLAPPFSGLQERIRAREAAIRGSSHAEAEERDSPHDADFSIADAAELLAAAARGPVSLACHTMHHACLPSLSPAEVRQECSASLEWLAQCGAPWLAWHAFPYGRWNSQCVDVLRRLHYGAAFLVDHEPVGTAGDLVHGRVNVPAGLSPEGLVIRLARALDS